MSQADFAPQDLSQLKKQAKTLLKAANSGDPKAKVRFTILGRSGRAESVDQ